MIDVSVIVINYNTYQLTSNCLASIIKYTQEINYEIILVDNASTECNPDLFLEQFPNIKLIKSKLNTGFAGGNNIGIAQALGKYILLLNSDAELRTNALKQCYDLCKANNNIGLIAAQLQYPNGNIQYNCRKFRTYTYGLLEFIPFKKKLLSEQFIKNHLLHHYFNHQSYCEPDWVWGAFMFIPIAVIHHLPEKKLSEDFFMYCEDVLWCYQIKQLNKKICFYPDVKVMHIHHGSSKTIQKMINIVRTSIKNHAQVIQSYYKGWKWLIFAPIYYGKQYLLLFAKIILIKLKISYE